MIDMERECPHRIVRFQAHPTCQQRAMLCEEDCHSLHDNLHITQPCEQIKTRYLKIRQDLKVQIRKYTDLLKSFFSSENELIRKIHEENVKMMERQLLANFFVQIAIDRNTMDKVYNGRLETLKCCEVYSLIRREKFMEEVEWEKMDQLYMGYRRKEIYRGEGNEQTGSEVNRDRYRGAEIDLVRRERDILSRELEALRLEMARQESIRSHAAVERGNRNRERVAVLMQKTFNICKVKTRKIKKNARETHNDMPLPEKQTQRNREDREQPSELQPIDQEHQIIPQPEVFVPSEPALEFPPLSFLTNRLPVAAQPDDDESGSISDLIELMKRKGHFHK